MSPPDHSPPSSPSSADSAAPEGATCGTCDWHYVGGRGRPVDRCRRHGDERVGPSWPACPSWLDDLACETCGACCRAAFHVVELGPRDPFCRKHPELVDIEDGRLVLRRNALGRCPALVGGEGYEHETTDGAYRCGIYGTRPQTCRDFTLGSANCVEARKRVGLC